MPKSNKSNNKSNKSTKSKSSKSSSSRSKSRDRHNESSAGGGDYYRAENINSEEDDQTEYTMGESSSRRLPWYQTKNGMIISGIGGFLVLMMIMKHHRHRHGGRRGQSYSYAEECVDNLMVSVNQDCGKAIWGYDCDGTLDCQVAHNNIYCAKCGCNNDLIGDLFEDLPNECKQFFS